jgi:hypothetical protein
MGRSSNSLWAREAVSSAQLIPCPWFDHLLRLDELSGAGSPSAFADSCPAEYERLLIPSFKEPVCYMQHAVTLDFVLLSQGVPDYLQPVCEIQIFHFGCPRDPQ